MAPWLDPEGIERAYAELVWRGFCYGAEDTDAEQNNRWMLTLRQRLFADGLCGQFETVGESFSSRILCRLDPPTIEPAKPRRWTRRRADDEALKRRHWERRLKEIRRYSGPDSLKTARARYPKPAWPSDGGVLLPLPPLREPEPLSRVWRDEAWRYVPNSNHKWPWGGGYAYGEIALAAVRSTGGIPSLFKVHVDTETPQRETLRSLLPADSIPISYHHPIADEGAGVKVVTGEPRSRSELEHLLKRTSSALGGVPIDACFIDDDSDRRRSWQIVLAVRETMRPRLDARAQVIVSCAHHHHAENPWIRSVAGMVEVDIPTIRADRAQQPISLVAVTPADKHAEWREDVGASDTKVMHSNMQFSAWVWARRQRLPLYEPAPEVFVLAVRAPIEEASEIGERFAARMGEIAFNFWDWEYDILGVPERIHFKSLTLPVSDGSDGTTELTALTSELEQTPALV